MPDKIQAGLDGVLRRFTDMFDGSFTEAVEARVPKNARDVMGRAKISIHQNIYDADFEYSTQALRWEVLNSGGGSVAHVPGEGGVRMSIGTAANAATIRQSRPYHRYQPGKAMFMATAVNFGANNVNQVQRVGYFDDNNGIFFEQGANPLDPANPSGMFAVVRTDVQSALTQGRPTDVKIPAYMWSDPRGVLPRLNWSRLQMLWLEYAWYGGGSLRWGVLLDGEPYILHEIGSGNNEPSATQSSQPPLGGPSTASSTTSLTVSTANWIANQWASRTLQITPSTTVAASSAGQTLPQATINVASTTGFPSSGQVFVGNQLVNYTGITGTSLTGCSGGNLTLTAGLSVQSLTTTLARITSNTANTLTLVDSVTGQALTNAPVAGGNYTIGLVDRGQLLPRQLIVSCDAVAIIEIVSGTPTLPVTLTGASFQAVAALGSGGSFAERDVSATALSGGEVVMAFTSIAGSGVQQIDLANLFPLFSNIRGDSPDTLTVAVSTPSTGGPWSVGAHVICQEAMS